MQKQLIPIQFGGGINTKVDPKQLQAGQLIDLQNGQFSKQGQINKRFGYDILNTTIEGGGAISAGNELANYKNELLLFDGNNIYTYLPATGNWSNRGVAISITTEDKDIIRLSAAQQLNPDMAYLNGIEIYAWEDSRGGVRYSVLDTTTKGYAVSDALISSSGAQPKCIAFQNQIFIFYSDGADHLYYKTVNPFNPTALTAAINVVFDGKNSLNGFPYDAAVIGNKLFVVYLAGSPATGSINAFFLDSGFNQTGFTVIEATNGVANNPGFKGAINVVGDSNNDVWISWANGVDVRTSCWSYTLVNILPTTLVDTADVRVLTGIEGSIATTLLLCYEVHATLSYNEQTRYNTITTAGVLGTAITRRSVGLASKAFKYNGNIYVNTAYESTLQAKDFTMYIANSNGVLTTPVEIAKITDNVGGGLQTNNMCPETVILSPGVFKFANLAAGKIISEANTVFTLYGVNSTKLIFTPSNNFIHAEQANTLLIAGGILQGYDGVSVTENGFHLYPENIVAAANNGMISGNLGIGTYQYMVQFEWTDNNGQIYRSAPSIPSSINVVINSDSATIIGPCLRLTQKTTAISVVIYRTQANGSIFYRVSSTLAPTLNSTTSDTWIFTDTLSDAAAASNELNYTTGGILSNISPPASSIISTYNNRVILGGLSDKLLLWYSQSVVDNSNLNTIPPQFAAELTTSVDPRGSDITALGVLNGALIIFKSTEVFALQGNGPDATGANNDFGDANLLTADAGCINQNSVVIMPQGLMFQSAKGIYLLDQALNLEYIGAPVEDFNSLTITSSALHSQFNQVIFTTSNGIALVYDYYFRQWSRWTNHYVADAGFYGSKFCYLRSNGQVYVQNTSKFTDGSNPYYLNFTLPNLSFAGLQGFQRVFKCFILGSYKGPHTLNVQVAYDYNDNYIQSATINPSTNISTWGSDGTWGAGQFWGGSYQIYEFRVDFAIQKCTSIRLNISDNQASNYNEGYSISNIVFEVGVLPGGNRMDPNNRYGTK